MIVIDISEPRYMFMEYLKSINVEYSNDKFLMFLSGSLFRICGVRVESNPIYHWSQQDLLVSNTPHLDVYVTKWFPMEHMWQIRTSGQVGDYYLIKVVGNSGVLYHVNENGSLHNTV